jgi:hypothetical protein
MAPVPYPHPAPYAPLAPPVDEVAALKAEAEYLTAALEETRARLEKLEADSD